MERVTKESDNRGRNDSQGRDNGPGKTRGTTDN